MDMRWCGMIWDKSSGFISCVATCLAEHHHRFRLGPSSSSLCFYGRLMDPNGSKSESISARFFLKFRSLILQNPDEIGWNEVHFFGIPFHDTSRGWDFYHKDKTFLSDMLAAWNIDARWKEILLVDPQNGTFILSAMISQHSRKE
jgi:hypothetical protein